MKNFKLANLFIYPIGIAVVCYYVFCWLTGIKQIINWQVMSQLGDVSAIIDRFTLGAQNFEIPAKVYYITEQYVASGMQINESANAIWLGIFTLAITILWAISTQLKGLWYYAATSVLLLAMVALSIDELFGQSNYLYSGLVLFSLLSLSFYFNTYNKEAHFWLKFLLFGVLFVILALIISKYANQNAPILFLAAKATIPALILAVFFIFFIAYDIILAVLTLTTKGGAEKSLVNFSIFTLIYLINIGLTQLHNIKWIDWQMLYINPFLLLLVSIIIGFIFLKKKEQLFNTIFKASNELTLTFFAFSILSLGLNAYQFSIGNDPAIEAMEDFIIYTHFVMGLCFFAYVFFNFFPLFRQKYDVAKVVFKPLQFALYYFRGAAILIIFAILINNQFFPVMQSFAGFYNTLADHSVATKQYQLAEIYYKNAIGFERQNHKSNYGLASLAALQGDNRTAGAYYRLAVQKKPTEFAFAALSNTLQNEDLFFEAMFALKDGLKIYPKSGELQNNLALLFEKSKAIDSSLFYLEKAKVNAENKNIIEANLLAFYIKYGDAASQNKAFESASSQNYNSLNTNWLALNIVLEKKKPIQHFFNYDNDLTLSMPNYAQMHNEVITKRAASIPFQKILADDSNFNLANDLQITQVFSAYYGGKKLAALELLQNQLSTDTTENAKYKQLLFNTLLKKTQEEKNTEPIEIPNKWSALAYIDRFPLEVTTLNKTIAFLNKSGNSKEAYEALINAKKWKPESTEILKLYILQCFKIHMLPYAKDGLAQLKITNLAQYNSFLPVYQAQMALVEKANEGFE